MDELRDLGTRAIAMRDATANDDIDTADFFECVDWRMAAGALMSLAHVERTRRMFDISVAVRSLGASCKETEA
jgi:hypothetical protein